FRTDPVAGHPRSGAPGGAATQPVLLAPNRAGLPSNHTRLVREGDDWRIEGDTTEGALLVLAGKAGLERGEEAARSPRTDSIPFESEHRFTASLHHAADGSAAIHVVRSEEHTSE